MSLTTHSLTRDDLARLPDDGNRYELIGGVLYVSPAPSRRHLQLTKRLFRLFDRHVEESGLGAVFVAPHDVRLSAHDVVQPDLFVIGRDRYHLSGPSFVAGAPDLVVEILSPSKRDRDLGAKLDLYARAGVLEYWVGDPDTPCLEIYTLRDGRYELLTPVNGTVTSAVFDRLVVDVATLLADLDAIPKRCPQGIDWEAPMAITPRSLTYDDLTEMPDDGNRYEIIGGVLCVSPSPTEVHQSISFRLTLLVGNFVIAERLGKVYAAPFDVRLSEQDVVQPDLIFVSHSRLSIIGQSCIEGAPDLLIEILSPSTRDRDRTQKPRLYAVGGVPEYWLVDPEARTVTVLTLEHGTYRALPQEHGRVRSAVLPGFELDLAALFPGLGAEG